jgi:CRP-like cAMP-binding protein
VQPSLRRRPGANAFVRHINSLVGLTPREMLFLEEQTASSRLIESGTELHAVRDSENQRILIAGWACRQRLLPDGRRQIVTFLVPGDIIGPLQWPVQPASGASVALTRVEVADATYLLQRSSHASHDYPALARARQLLVLLEDVFLHDQIVRLGRHTAYERMIHLILELRFRLALAGLVDGAGFALPLTQDVLADALGLSLVHANRTLQQIRRDGLMELRAGRVTILRPDIMEEIVDWTPPLGLQA